MYKVFIEKRPVYIAKEKPIDGEIITVRSEEVTSFEENIHPLFKKKRRTKQPIFIQTDRPKEEFKRLFKDYKKVIAAGGIVKNKKEYLFIKRKGKWDIPKGKLEKGEKKKEGAIREIEEECGINNPRVEQLICITYHTYRFKSKPTLKKTYWYELTYDGNDALKPQKNEGITKVKWFKKKKLNKIYKNTFSSITDVLDAYFGEN